MTVDLLQILKGIQMMKKYLSELDRVQEVSQTFKSHYVSSIQVSWVETEHFLSDKDIG